MAALGAFSYLYENDTRAFTCTITLSKGTQYTLRLLRVTDFMATLTYITLNGVDIAPPVQTTVYCPSNGQITPQMGISWPIVWHESYMVRILGQDVLQLSTQRQQSVFKLGNIKVEDANHIQIPPQVPPADADLLVNGVPAIVPGIVPL